MCTNILVTGFGPFRDHKINASWEAVKLLPDNINGYNIVKKEISVTYYDVETNVPTLWKELKPVVCQHYFIFFVVITYYFLACDSRRCFIICYSTNFREIC